MRIIPGAHLGWLTTGELVQANNKTYPKQIPQFRFKPSKIVQTNPAVIQEYAATIRTFYGVEVDFNKLFENVTTLYYKPHIKPPYFIRHELMGREQPICVEVEPGVGFNFVSMQTRKCQECTEKDCTQVFRLYIRPVFRFMLNNPDLVDQIPFYFTYTTRSRRVMEQIIKAHEIESPLYMLSIRVESGFAPVKGNWLKRDFVRVNAIPIGIHEAAFDYNVPDEIEIDTAPEEVPVQPNVQVDMDYDQIVEQLLSRGVPADVIATTVNEKGMEGLKELLKGV